MAIERYRRKSLERTARFRSSRVGFTVTEKTGCGQAGKHLRASIFVVIDEIVNGCNAGARGTAQISGAFSDARNSAKSLDINDFKVNS